MRKFSVPFLCHLAVDLHDELPEHHGTHVVGQDMEETPVAKLKLVGDVVQDVTDSLLGGKY